MLRSWKLPVALLLAGLPLAAPAADAAPAPCRVAGIANEVLCGSVSRPLDPARPDGARIDVHYAVVPAKARRKRPDPVVLLAGGPGQSAIGLAPDVMALLGRLNNRRDVVFVDQRGTGRSAPLACEEDQDRRAPIAEQADPERLVRRMAECRAALVKLPHVRVAANLGFFTTTIAMQDLDAVRQVLGAPRINLVGASYGTRAALEYMRQFPDAVRRVVIDGVAPPDMVLPATVSPDAQAVFDALLAACTAEPACAKNHPTLRADWDALLKGLPRPSTIVHPLTGRAETFTLTRDIVLSAVRGPLYAPWLAAALPVAIGEAAQGRDQALLTLGTRLGSRRATDLAMGMHFSVVCAEDAPRLAASADRPGADFGPGFAAQYARVCADWPRGVVPAAFYSVPPFPRPVWVGSGGLDPVTPPRHGGRIAKALGPTARHIVIANAGHGTMSIGCLRDLLFRFVDATEDSEALAIDASCATAVPRPLAFEPVRAEVAR